MDRSSALRTSCLLVTLVVVLGACKRTGGAVGGAVDAAPSASVGASPAERLARGPLEVKSGDDEFDVRLEPVADGYRVTSRRGHLGGRVHVERGSVKLLDASGATASKVKAKDFGYKVYDGTDAVVLKAKRRGDGYAWKTGQDADLGRWERGQGTVGGQDIRVQSLDGRTVVLRGGQPVGSVSGSVPMRAAAVLALTELTFQQRLAALLYELEVSGP
jgi:hypothetical protein